MASELAFSTAKFVRKANKRKQRLSSEMKGTNKNIKPPQSLNKIFKTLYYQGLIKNLQKNGNLEEWAKQGILLLNLYLTRNPNIDIKNEKPFVKSNG